MLDLLLSLVSGAEMKTKKKDVKRLCGVDPLPGRACVALRAKRTKMCELRARCHEPRGGPKESGEPRGLR